MLDSDHIPIFNYYSFHYSCALLTSFHTISFIFYIIQKYPIKRLPLPVSFQTIRRKSAWVFYWLTHFHSKHHSWENMLFRITSYLSHHDSDTIRLQSQNDLFLTLVLSLPPLSFSLLLFFPSFSTDFVLYISIYVSITHLYNTLLRVIMKFDSNPYCLNLEKILFWSQIKGLAETPIFLNLNKNPFMVTN